MPLLERARRIAVSAAVSLVLVARASADDQRPQFEGNVDVVAVDANVVDGKGRPVPDIALEEFVVKVDGRSRRVLSAEFFALGATAGALGTTSGVSPAPAVERDSAVAAPEAMPSRLPGRLVVLVVDRGELSGGAVQKAAEAAARLLDQLSPEDRVAVFTLPSGPRLDFTSDRAAVDRALGRIGPAPDVTLAERTLPLQQRLEAHLNGATDRLNALEALLGALAGIQRAKVLVLISGGFTTLEAPMVRDRPDPSAPSLFFQSAAGVTQHLRRIATAAAAARTSLYSIYVSERAGAFEAAKGLGEISSPLADPQYRAATLNNLTAMTGGVMLEVVAGANHAFERVALETSGQYLLGLEPADGDRDGKPHNIEVKVRRKNVEVRARRQFVIANRTGASLVPR